MIRMINKIMAELQLDSNRVIKMKTRPNQIIFERKQGKYFRRLLLTPESYNKMEDVSLMPNMRVDLDRNISLINFGNRIQLIKYCTSGDGKRCEGGFFTFTLNEWQTFWKNYFEYYRECLNQ